MPSEPERIATLEAENVHTRETLAEIRADVKAIKATLSRQKGFIAGVLFVLTPIWAAVLVAGKAVWERFTEIGS